MKSKDIELAIGDFITNILTVNEQMFPLEIPQKRS
jgi:hypothetical protein